MKLISTFLNISLLICMCVFSRLSCMEGNNHIGEIDRAILFQEIHIKGKALISDKISIQRMGLEYGERHMPFIITLYLKNDNSHLANTVFGALNNPIASQNSENIRWNNKTTSLIPIDHCSCARKINHDTVMAMAIFHDKLVLQKVFAEHYS